MNEIYPLARDMDVVLEVLRWAEKGGFPKDAPARDELTLAVHVRMMIEAELIEGVADYSRLPGRDAFGAIVFTVQKLRWKGAEFLEATKNDAIWQRVKAEAKSRSIPMLFDLAGSLARGLAAQSGLTLG